MDDAAGLRSQRRQRLPTSIVATGTIIGEVGGQNGVCILPGKELSQMEHKANQTVWICPEFMDPAIKEELLVHAIRNPVNGFLRIEYSINDMGTMIDFRDYELHCSAHAELAMQHSGDMGLQIPENYTAEEVINGLIFMIEWLRENPSILENIPGKIADEKIRMLQIIQGEQNGPFGVPF
jgi:hypothetical protein